MTTPIACHINNTIDKSIQKWRGLKAALSTTSTAMMDENMDSPSENPDATPSTSSPSDTTNQNLDPSQEMPNSTTDADADTTENVSYKLVIDAITELRNTRQRPTSDNIIEQFKEKGLSENIASELITFALDHEHIQEYRYSNQTCYKILNSALDDDANIVIIRDPIENASSQTETCEISTNETVIHDYVTLSEFNDLKDKLSADIESIRSMKSLNSSIPQNLASNEPPYLNAYIKSLLDRISFLEETLQSVIAKQHENFNILATNMSPNIPPFHPNAVQSQPINVADQPPNHTSSTTLNNQQKIKSFIPAASANTNSSSKQIKASNAKASSSKNDITKSSSTGSSTARFTNNKTVEIIGDSMLLGINEKEMRDKHHVRVRPYSGAKTFDMSNLAAISARRKPDACIMHVGSNDFNDASDAIDSISNMEEAFKLMQKESPETKLCFSMTFLRHDKGKKVNHDIRDFNERMKVLCRRYQVELIDNYNIKRHHLGKKGWHPNQDGKDFLTENWLDFVNKL